MKAFLKEMILEFKENDIYRVLVIYLFVMAIFVGIGVYAVISRG